jgi:hypothetical protein
METLDDGRVQLKQVDLKRIEKRNTSDVVISRQSLIQVFPKQKVVTASGETISARCLVCGCNVMPGIHGWMILPGRLSGDR